MGQEARDMTVLKKIKFTWNVNGHDRVTVIDITKMNNVWGYFFYSKKEGLLIDNEKKKYCHYSYGKNTYGNAVESQESSPFTSFEFVNEREDESAIKTPLIEKILKKGLPVVVAFDHQDSFATIWVKSETEIVTDDYGSDFTEPGEVKSLNDLTIEGLTKLHKYGIRPDDGEDYTSAVEDI
jgi:hypothetical protein